MQILDRKLANIGSRKRCQNLTVPRNEEHISAKITSYSSSKKDNFPSTYKVIFKQKICTITTKTSLCYFDTFQTFHLNLHIFVKKLCTGYSV